MNELFKKVIIKHMKKNIALYPKCFGDWKNYLPTLEVGHWHISNVWNNASLENDKIGYMIEYYVCCSSDYGNIMFLVLIYEDNRIIVKFEDCEVVE